MKVFCIILGFVALAAAAKITTENGDLNTHSNELLERTFDFFSPCLEVAKMVIAACDKMKHHIDHVLYDRSLKGNMAMSNFNEKTLLDLQDAFNNITTPFKIVVDALASKLQEEFKKHIKVDKMLP